MIRGHYVFFIIMKLNKSHICKYCGKEFDEGVQLGGHTRLCKADDFHYGTLEDYDED